MADKIALRGQSRKNQGRVNGRVQAFGNLRLQICIKLPRQREPWPNQPAIYILDCISNYWIFNIHAIWYVYWIPNIALAKVGATLYFHCFSNVWLFIAFARFEGYWIFIVFPMFGNNCFCKIGAMLHFHCITTFLFAIFSARRKQVLR